VRGSTRSGTWAGVRRVPAVLVLALELGRGRRVPDMGLLGWLELTVFPQKVMFVSRYLRVFRCTRLDTMLDDHNA